MKTTQDSPVAKKRIFLCDLLWMTAHLLTAMPIHWFLLVIGSDESDLRVVQLRNGDLSILPTYGVLLFVGLVIGTALAFLRAYVFRYSWPGPRYFAAGAKSRWILSGVLSGIPHGLLIWWKQQADSPHDAALSATSSFIVVPLIIIVTFWIVFRLFPLPHLNRQNLVDNEIEQI